MLFSLLDLCLYGAAVVLEACFLSSATAFRLVLVLAATTRLAVGLVFLVGLFDLSAAGLVDTFGLLTTLVTLLLGSPVKVVSFYVLL